MRAQRRRDAAEKRTGLRNLALEALPRRRRGDGGLDTGVVLRLAPFCESSPYLRRRRGQSAHLGGSECLDQQKRSARPSPHVEEPLRRRQWGTTNRVLCSIHIEEVADARAQQKHGNKGDGSSIRSSAPPRRLVVGECVLKVEEAHTASLTRTRPGNYYSGRRVGWMRSLA